MSPRDTQRVSRRAAAARKRIRLGQLQVRYRFRHGHAFDDFWAEQLLDVDVAALLASGGVARAAALEAGRA